MTDPRQELRDLTRHLVTTEPPEIYALRNGEVPGQPGTDGQFFTTWDFANSILRDYTMVLYKHVCLAADERLSVANVLTVMQIEDPIFTEFLGYCGFHVLASHTNRVREAPVTDRATLLAELSELAEYANRLAAWSHHYFPWNVGERYHYEPARYVTPPLPAGPDVMADRSHPSRRIPLRLTWEIERYGRREPLGEVGAELACDLNEALCADLIAALPFTVPQEHSVVSGGSMYAWAPLVSVAPTPVTERICDAPAGRLRFSQATGNKLVVQYGTTTEPLGVPVVGAVNAGDLGVLDKVGRTVWESTYHTKELIWLTVQLGR
jgi:hypothetical protein